ncbi:LysR family transcriptional regulator [Ensifer adhaerens]|uniref:LysR family transcriptional regulator n=1 Tax=Ensifer adhaerens TaxID=106592 RepID=UPI001CBF2852|nr:LysR family transcriptional regulator [Ensifer adhaerens]MBZ7927730.1 LysR family transcriptional regulator [Ensifer adhaerens]UAX96627.1 LysR family transcriptional regulator [Ensifer adhaerens]UAY04029.1 LysR family transcriptional regulator [Ensifer adhaerens]UAY12015.1 LysR family transcriptional regulator [Ensifer adhaerens]
MPYPYDLNDIHCFLQIARAGSISAAALSFNIPKATLSHSLRRLEDALQVELFVRRARGLQLTEAGDQFLANCGMIFESCENAVSAAQRAHSTLGGRLRLFASAEFGTTISGAATLAMSLAHPKIEFDIHLFPSERNMVTQNDFDCLIFVGEPPESSLLRRKMGSVSYGLYASPDFISKHGMPLVPEVVNDYDAVSYVRCGIPEEWQLSQGKSKITLKPRTKLQTNEYWMAKYFAVHGMAMGYFPDFFVKFETEQGYLSAILPEWRSDDIPVYVLYPAQRHRNPRVMSLVNVLCSQFEEFVSSPRYSLFSTGYVTRPLRG